MMPKIVAVVALKGGVGKTTLTVSLAEASAYTNYRPLLVDLDPQANASQIVVGGDIVPPDAPWNSDMTVASFLRDRLDMLSDEPDLYTTKDIRYFESGEAVSLLSGDPALRRLERRCLARQGATLDSVKSEMEQAIGSILECAKGFYDLAAF